MSNSSECATLPRPLRESAKNLQFTDLTFVAANSKVLINNVSGEFRAGELSAIVGPSGCGKTTLLNILASYRISQTSGHVMVEGKKLRSQAFRKLIRYISQVDHIDPYFTVMETLRYASIFKLKSGCGKAERQTVIAEILDIFKLKNQANTMCAMLSGGQRKRLSIALELLDGPSILILDEPTTGLDEFSAAQCVTHLKEISNKTGCTIVASIHSPSARILAIFNKMFAIAEGTCIYQGTAQGIVPYLQQFGLNCPISYNPADFLIEVATHVYGNFNHEMVRKTRKDQIAKTSKRDVDDGQESGKTLESEGQDSVDFKSLQTTSPHKESLEGNCRGTSALWWMDFGCTLKHIFHQLWRDKTNFYLRMLTDITLSSLIGLTFQNVGNNGALGVRNFYFCLATMTKCVFVSMTPMVAYVSQQMPYLRREHFNQWYKFSSFFMALLVSQIFISFIMTLLCAAITYFMSHQPMEPQRFLIFFGMSFITTLMGSSYGMLVGSMFKILNALFMCPVIVAVWLVITFYPTVPDTFSVLDYIIVYTCGLRYSLEGFMASLFLFDRSDLLCPQDMIVCVFSKPSYILKLTGCSDINIVRAVVGVLAFYVIFSYLAYRMIRIRFGPSKFMLYREYRYKFRKLLNLEMF